MKIILYRRNLSLTSGAGQLIRMQAEGLRAAGEQVRVASQRGGLKFLLRSGMRVKRSSPKELRQLAVRPDYLVVDHGMEVPEADLVFVHNLMAEAVRHLHRPDWAERAGQEAAFFSAVRPEVPIIANSELVKRALIEHFALSAERIIVHYPGFDSHRFRSSGVGGAAGAAQAARRRCESRAAVGIADHVPLAGFVTSGEFPKRGLDIFLDTAERIAAARPDVHFLVVGGKRLPEWAARHRLVSSRRLLYRPRSTRPERWFAALDLFIYPALFEEFGMVVSEAQACGLPVLTSRRVGAAECLPEVYDQWLIEAPDSPAFAEKALALLDSERTRADLSAAGIARIAAFDREHFVRSTVETIQRCARGKSRRQELVDRAAS